jgi:hypothetical protein
VKRHPVAVPLLLLFLSACGGSGNTTTAVIPQSQAPASDTRTQARPLVEAQYDALHSPQPQYTPSTNDLLYVGNVGTNTITVYHHDAQSDDAPIRVIAGSNTGITAPGQLSEDAQGDLYVVNEPKEILVFAKAANGNVKPLRTLNVNLPPPTAPGLLDEISAMTVDQATGKIYVAGTTGPDGGSSTLYRFAPNASGNAVPFASGTITYWPKQLANDSTGNNLIYDNGAQCCSSSTAGIQTVGKHFYQGTSPTSLYGVDDATTKTYLVTSSLGIMRLAENTVGSGPLNGYAASLTPAIVSSITSDTCGGELALGYLRNIYVIHRKLSGCSSDAVYVYTHDSSGQVSPLRVLSGSSTKLDQPYGIYEGQ